MIQLRQYQTKIIQDIRSQFRIGHKRIIVQSPTGSGKTIIFSYMVKEASQKGLRCLILTHRIELLEQANGVFENFGIIYDNITAKTKAVPNSLVLVAMVETIKRRLKARLDFQVLLRSINLLIIDEIHIASFDPVLTYINSECFVIGVTATPIRQNSKKPLCDNFTSLVLGPAIEKLINQGFLSAPEYYGVPVDLSKIKIKAGEFDEKEMEQLYSKTKLFEGLKHNIEMHSKGKKTMIFCPSVQSSINVARDLDCLHVDGTMPMNQREANLKEFESKPDSIITNCGITTMGYDHPAIQCIILYRATRSLPLYLQMIGRGSRVTEIKKTFKVLDFGMNIQRFGYWHVERKWSLEPLKKRSRKKDAFPVKFCPKCGAVLSVNVKTCEYCGYEWPVTEKERMFIELEKLTYAEIQEKMKKASVEEMESIRIAKGYKMGWILNRFRDFNQFQEYGKMKNYHPNWAIINAKRYEVM